MTVAVIVEQLLVANPTLGAPYNGSVGVRIFYPLDPVNPQDGDTSIELMLRFEGAPSTDAAVASALDRLSALGTGIVEAVAKLKTAEPDDDVRL